MRPQSLPRYSFLLAVRTIREGIKADTRDVVALRPVGTRHGETDRRSHGGKIAVTFEAVCGKDGKHTIVALAR